LPDFLAGQAERGALGQCVAQTLAELNSSAGVGLDLVGYQFPVFFGATTCFHVAQWARNRNASGLHVLAQHITGAVLRATSLVLVIFAPFVTDASR
jgi:hypothetical protein